MIGSGRGHIDFYGHVPATGHYLLGGWASEDLIDIVQAGDLALDFEDGTVASLASGATYPRPALGGLGTGIIIFVTAADAAHGRLQSVRLGTGTSSVRIVPSPDATAADQAAIRQQHPRPGTRSGDGGGHPRPTSADHQHIGAQLTHRHGARVLLRGKGGQGTSATSRRTGRRGEGWHDAPAIGWRKRR